jgi:hypothetical protein
MNWNNNVYKYLRLHESGNILVLINGQGEDMPVDFSELIPLLGRKIQVLDLLNDQPFDLDLEQGLQLEKEGIRVFLLNM